MESSYLPYGVTERKYKSYTSRWIFNSVQMPRVPIQLILIPLHAKCEVLIYSLQNIARLIFNLRFSKQIEVMQAYIGMLYHQFEAFASMPQTEQSRRWSNIDNW